MARSSLGRHLNKQNTRLHHNKKSK
uniref:Uncharacterized protein n=1 Tax=Arundo donax TaxID=35708 RepID=A0A0A8ZDW2_ARUDO